MIENDSLYLDGVDDSADAGNYAVTGNQLTLSAWINLDSIGTDPRIISKSQDSVVQDWVLGVDDGPDIIDFRVNTGTLTRLTGGSVELNTWIHVAGVYDGNSNTMTIYKNAVEVASENKNGALRETFDPIIIGDNMPGNIRPFNGHLDDLRVYSLALSPVQISEIFHEGLAEHGDLIFISGFEE